MSAPRRKLSPSPIARSRESNDVAPRALEASTVRSFTLPTVAALMLTLAGCASPPKGEHIRRDEPKPTTAETETTPTTATSAKTAMIGGATMVESIAPDPQQMDGQMAVVMPPKKGPPTTPPSVPVHIAPTSMPKHLGGDVSPTFP
jgi:hypothetical protein